MEKSECFDHAFKSSDKLAKFIYSMNSSKQIRCLYIWGKMYFFWDAVKYFQTFFVWFRFIYLRQTDFFTFFWSFLFVLIELIFFSNFQMLMCISKCKFKWLGVEPDWNEFVEFLWSVSIWIGEKNHKMWHNFFMLIFFFLFSHNFKQW